MFDVNNKNNNNVTKIISEKLYSNTNGHILTILLTFCSGTLDWPFWKRTKENSTSTFFSRLKHLNTI